MKHAYLIIAHNDFDILEKQLRLLDDNRNDFYIHIDKKVKDFPYRKFLELTQFSAVRFIESTDIRWGDFSMVTCELSLLKAAIKGNYRYYHLLSGVDMPLKTNNEIHAFFAEHDGLQFVHFCPDYLAEAVRDRMDRYYLMRWWKPPKRGVVGFVAKMTVRLVLYMQRVLGIRRKINKNMRFGYGSQWFSITSELARYVLSNEGWIRRHFRFACCSDEHFMQTLILQSPFADSLFIKDRRSDCMANMRYIEWTRGRPHAFCMADKVRLMDSPYLFARKFSTTIDSRVVDSIFDEVWSKNNIQKS